MLRQSAGGLKTGEERTEKEERKKTGMSEALTRVYEKNWGLHLRIDLKACAQG